jgi:hypothetical protein
VNDGIAQYNHRAGVKRVKLFFDEDAAAAVEADQNFKPVVKVRLIEFGQGIPVQYHIKIDSHVPAPFLKQRRTIKFLQEGLTNEQNRKQNESKPKDF